MAAGVSRAAPSVATAAQPAAADACAPTGIDFGAKDFTDAAWQATRTDDDFVNSITNGNPDNSNYLPFGDMLSEEEIKAMVPCVRAFAQ